MHLKMFKHWLTRKSRTVRVVDRYVILVMAVLLLQSLLTLCLPHEQDDSTMRIDVVLRTTMVSIFGYLVSSNFIGRDDLSVTALPATETGEKTKISTRRKLQLSRLQVRLVGQICLFSVIVLLLIRFWFGDDEFSSGYVYLYRDFISSSVGFLIGIPPGTAE